LVDDNDTIVNNASLNYTALNINTEIEISDTATIFNNTGSPVGYATIKDAVVFEATENSNTENIGYNFIGVYSAEYDGSGNIVKFIEINETYSFNKDELSGTDLLELNNVKIEGEIIKNSLGNIELNLYVEGTMILPCAITLKPVKHPFNIEISGEIEELMQNFEENERNFQNSIDILPIIWENILMEIPMRVVSEEANNSDIKMEGNGWKFVTEEEEIRSPLGELMDYLNDSEVK
jgi:uncharacterized protein